MRRKYCLCNDIWKWLVFSDKADKPWATSDSPSMFITLWDVREPAHYSQRVEHGVPGFVLCPLWYIMLGMRAFQRVATFKLLVGK